MNWLHYLAEANLYLGVFYLAYCVFLNKETYYQLNRIYLICSCIIAYILPVLQVGALKHVEALPAAESYALVNMIPPPPPMSAPMMVAAEQPYQLTLTDVLWYGYLVGVVILLLVLAIRLYNLFRIVHLQKCVEQGSYKLIYIKDSQSAFSFFNYLFIGTDAPGVDTIIRHELVHIHQKHSADIIFLEVLKIINWFNPFIYLLQNSLKAVHEYIADEQTATYETNALAYSSFLVNNAYGVGGPSITQPFSTYHLLKKRIIMLNQQRSGNLAKLKYLVAVPICAGLLCASTLGFSKTYGWVDLAPAKIREKFNHTLLQTPAITGPQLSGKKSPSPLLNQSDKSAMILKGNEHKEADPAPEKNIALTDSPDSADIVTPSGYKRGYEKLVWHFGLKNSLFLNNYIFKNFIIDNKNRTVKGGIVVVGFNVSEDHKLSDLKVVSSTNEELNSVITNSLTSFKGTIDDKPGAHTFLFHISTTGHTEEADEILCRKYGYDNHYTIAIAPEIIVNDNRQKQPPPPPKPNVDQVKFPPPIVIPDELVALSRYLNKISYPKNMITANGSVIVNYTINNDHKIADVKLVKSSKAFEQVALATLNALNAYTGTVNDKPGEHIAGINFYSSYIRQVINKEFKNDPRYSGELYIMMTPPKPKTDQVKFPPPIIRPDLSNFYRFLHNTINYPAKAKENNTQGYVVATFTVKNNQISDIKAITKAGDGLEEEVTRVLQNEQLTNELKPGKYAMPFRFALGGIDGEPSKLVPAPAKKQGYTYLNEVVIVAYGTQKVK